MKTLQNNFTSPEQSKRLLELGLPADSADMLWDGIMDINDGWEFEDYPTYTGKPFSYYQLLYRQEETMFILPCWSVGRLMEIFDTCYTDLQDISRWLDYTTANNRHGDFMSYVITAFKSNLDKIDFSKLEE